MQKSGAARRQVEREENEVPMGPGVEAATKGRRKKTPVGLDRVIHERVRLAIVSALAGTHSMTFGELRDVLEITDGNLSVHARRLEEAGFIKCEKSFVERVPRTVFQLTTEGRTALNGYLDHMESLIRRVREG